MSSLTPNEGDGYMVSIAGGANLNGETNWKVKDVAAYWNGQWAKIDNTDDVLSVNSKTGIVTIEQSDLEFQNSGSPTQVTNLHDAVNRMWSAGAISGFGLTENGDGTVTIANGEAVLRHSDSPGADMTNFAITGGTTGTELPALIDNGTTVLCIDYNGGTPIWIAILDITTINATTVVPVWTVTRIGNITHILPLSGYTLDFIKHELIKHFYVYGAEHELGTSIITDKGDLSLDITAGAFYVFSQRIPHGALDTQNTHTITAVDPVGESFTVAGDQTAIYNVGRKIRVQGSTGNDGVYTVVSATYTTSTEIVVAEDVTDGTIDGDIHYDTFMYVSTPDNGTSWTRTYGTVLLDNANYNDRSSGLASLTNNHFSVHWVYTVLNTPAEFVVMYGVDSYASLAEAQAAIEPDIKPPELRVESTGFLLGKVIIQEGTVVFSDIQVPWSDTLTSTSASSHNGLSGLQGGGESERYHFLAAEHQKLLDTIDANNYAKERSGFETTDPDVKTTMSFVNGTRTFTIQPIGASYDIFYSGTKITKSSPENIVIGTTTGEHFIYFDSSGVIQTSTNSWDLSVHLPIAIVYWNANNSLGWIQYENHGLEISWKDHYREHFAHGTRYINGFGISGYTLLSPLDVDVQFGLGNGEIMDEDIRMPITHNATPTNPFEQVLNDPAQVPVMHLENDGTPGSNLAWVLDTPTNFWYKYTVAGRVNYNDTIDGDQQEATNNNYVAYFIVATNFYKDGTGSILPPIVSIQGQRQDSSLLDAIANNNFSELATNLPFTEFKLLYIMFVRTSNSFANTGQVQIEFIEDRRFEDTGGSAAAGGGSSHAGLGDLGYAQSGHTGFGRLDYPTTTDPTNNNDDVDTAGIGRTFRIGDMWINTNTNEAYKCVDNTTGAAIWTNTTKVVDHSTLTKKVLSTYSTNLIRSYPLSEVEGTTIKDLSSNREEGTINSVLLNQGITTDGKPAAFFDKDSYANAVITSGMGTDFDGDNGSVVFRFKFDKGAQWLDGSKEYFIHIYGDSDNNLFLAKWGSFNPTLRYSFNANAVSKAKSVVIDTTDAHNGWNTFGITWNSTTGNIYLYFNGALIDTETGYAGGWTTAPTDVRIASRNGGSTFNVEGFISDVNIWDTDLAQASMEDLTSQYTIEAGDVKVDSESFGQRFKSSMINAQDLFNELDKVRARSRKIRFDDFDDSNFNNWGKYTSSATIEQDRRDDDMETYGVVDLFVASGSSGRARLSQQSPGEEMIKFGLGELENEFRILFDDTHLPSSSDDHTIVIGYATVENTFSNINNGAYFRIRWSGTALVTEAITESGGTETVTPLTNVVADTIYTFGIKVNAAGNSIEFYINSSLVATHTTNITSSYVSPQVYLNANSALTNRVDIYVDWSYNDVNWSTSRSE